MYKIVVHDRGDSYFLDSKIKDDFVISFDGKKENLQELIEAMQRSLKLIVLKKCEDDGELYEKYVTDPFKYDIPDNDDLAKVCPDFEVIYN